MSWSKYIGINCWSTNGQTATTIEARNRTTGWAKKAGHRLTTIIWSNLKRLKKFTGKFYGKFAVKWILKIPPHLVYVATLPCETLMSIKQAINDKLQDTVATYLRCAGIVNNEIKKGLLLRLWVNFVLNRWIFGKVTSKSHCLVHFVRLANILLKTKKVHDTITFLLVTLPNIHRF